jgi:S1-C subfamily serine protease
MSRGTAGCLTVALHSLLAALVMVSCTQVAPAAVPSGGAPRPMDVVLLESTPAGMLACPGRIYEGVGFTHSWGGFVIQVAPGSPAARAGMQQGDFVSGYEIIDSLSVGDCLTLTLTREDQDRKIRLCLERICQG